MTLVTTVNATGLISQLADELVTSYTADNKTITQIVTDLLAFQVLTPAITVGTIDPTVSRSISVEGDTILKALYRLRDTVGGHIYVDNNRALQWKTTIGEDKGQQIRYRKNLKGITREIDYTTLANRLYAYGAGEGDARIKLSDAEGQTEDYVEDEGSQTEWKGIYIRVIVDKSITHPDTLLAWANLRLDDLKNPRITYQVDTVDLSESIEVDFSFEALQIGSIIKVIDEDLGIDVSAQVVKITHPDLLHPELMEIEVANRIKDISDSLAEVYDIQQLIQHIATKIGAGQVVVKGAFTVKDWVTDGETTIVGSHIETGTISLNRLDFVPLSAAAGKEADEIIATINATDEGGLKISASKLEAIAGVNVFKQPNIPTSEKIGDLWFDTDDANKLYRAACIDANEIKADEWELVRDEQIAANLASIGMNANNISLNVTDISNLDGRVTTAEGEISVNADDILLKVSKDGVIGSINISPEVVKISASKVELEGTVVFVGGAAADVNAGVTTISGGKITAGTLTVTSAEIESLEAGKITGQIVNAQIANIDFAKIYNVEIESADIISLAAGKITGLIDGSHIELDGNTIVQGDFEVSGDAIFGGTIDARYVRISHIDADEITAGSIDCRDIRVYHIDADEIDAGSLSGDRISGGTISGVIFSQADGHVVIDANGITVDGQFLNFKYGSYHGLIYMEGNDLIITADGDIKFDLRDLREVSDIYCDDIHSDHIEPNAHEIENCGYPSKAWKQVCTKYLYTKSTSWQSYQGHDDLALLKAIKSKKQLDKHMVDADTLPIGVVIENKQKEKYVDVSAFGGFSIGVQKALLKRLEALEARVDTLKPS